MNGNMMNLAVLMIESNTDVKSVVYGEMITCILRVINNL